MKLNKLSLVLFAITLAACSSIKQPDVVYELPDYTAEDVKNEEIKRIEDILKDNATLALWRAYLLDDKSTFDKCVDCVVKLYDEQIKNENVYEAEKYLITLEAVDYDEVKQLKKSFDPLYSEYYKKIPGLTSVNGSQIKKVSQFVDGTVTVIVDKGIKVQRGMGFADRVIGSGFFISKDGYIVTNHHVISDMVDPKNEGFARLYIKLASDSDTKIPAKVIGWDPIIDLALLKTEVEAPYVFNLGSSEELDVGDKVFAIGSPVGLERTLTSGIVSAVDRKLFSLGSVMQIDAAVNSGNSGGPCIDQNGNVQAIVFAGMLQYEGLNFAIPVEYLKAELPALYNGGKLEHSWFSGFGHTKKELGKESGLDIQYILPGGALSRNGIKVGDIITEVNGTSVKTIEDVQNILLYSHNKSIVKIKYKRGENQVRECAVYLSPRPENPGYIVYNSDILSRSFVPIFGMSLVSVSDTVSYKYYIETIIQGSVGDETGFAENDPVEVRNVKFNEQKSQIFAEIYTKNRKKGYLDISIALVAALDSPYYF